MMVVIKPGSFFIENYQGANPGDTSLDSSLAINSALKDAQGTGGTVYGGGKPYAVRDQDIDIPENVTLQGTFKYAPSHTSEYNGYWGPGHDMPLGSGGTELHIFRNKANENAKAAITGRTNSALRGCVLFYPEQAGPSAESPIPFPPTFFSSHTNNVSVENCEFINSYHALLIQQSHRGLFRNITGQVLYKGLRTEGGGDVNRLENIHWGAMYTYNTPLWQYGLANGTAFEFGREDLIKCMHLFAFGVGTNYHFINTPDFAGGTNGQPGAPSKPWGEFTGCSSDFCTRCIVVEAGQSLFINMIGGQHTSQSDSPILTINPSFWGNFKLASSALFHSKGKFADLAGSGTIAITGNMLSGFYDTAGAGYAGQSGGPNAAGTLGGKSTNTAIIAAGTGAINIMHNEFLVDQPQVNAAASIVKGRVGPNFYTGAKRVNLNGNSNIIDG